MHANGSVYTGNKADLELIIDIVRPTLGLTWEMTKYQTKGAAQEGVLCEFPVISIQLLQNICVQQEYPHGSEQNMLIILAISGTECTNCLHITHTKKKNGLRTLLLLFFFYDLFFPKSPLISPCKNNY